MYKCTECGHIFEYGEEKKRMESRGEFGGSPCFEEMIGCPLCGGEYEETIPCKICGSEHLEEELNGGVCDSCIDEYRKDFDFCYNISINIESVIIMKKHYVFIVSFIQKYFHNKH